MHRSRSYHTFLVLSPNRGGAWGYAELRGEESWEVDL